VSTSKRCVRLFGGVAVNSTGVVCRPAGENWEDECYNDKYGWELPATWVKSVPKRGKLVTTYTSTSQGCQPRFAARHLLKRKVLTWT